MTPPPGSARTTDRTPLALTSVLASALPTTLGTPEAPERYMVPAVFSRAPSARETAILQSDRSTSLLSTEGRGAVRLRVSDRRLEIHDTNLQELKHGLAATIARVLAEATSLEDDEHASRRAAADTEAAAELHRLRTIADEAAQIRFVLEHRP